MELLNGLDVIIGTLGEFIKNTTVLIIFVIILMKSEWLINRVKSFKEFRVNVGGLLLETISIERVKDEFISIEEDITRLTKNRPMGGPSPYLTYNERIDIVDKVLVLQSFGVQFSTSKNSNLLLLMGSYHYHCHEYPTAATYFKKATLLKDESSSAYCNLGWTKLRQKKEHDALACFKRAIDQDSTNAHALLGLAIVYRRRKEVDKATQAIQDAIKLFELLLEEYPKDYLSHCGIGRAKVEFHKLANMTDDQQLDAAIKHYNDAIELEGNWALAYYQKACAIMRYDPIDDDKKNQSLAALLKSIFINPLFREHALKDDILTGITSQKCYKCVVGKQPPKAVA